MATSTADLIRADIVTAVQAIAVSSLGFDNANGNIRSYLYEEEQPEHRPLFFVADVDGEKRQRCWAFQVYERDVWDGSVGIDPGNRQKGVREYEIVCEAYYGFHGSNPTNLMITHARKVRQAIVGLGLRLSDRVNSLRGFSQFAPRPEAFEGADVAMAKGQMTAIAWKFNPDF